MLLPFNCWMIRETRGGGLIEPNELPKFLTVIGNHKEHLYVTCSMLLKIPQRIVLYLSFTSQTLEQHNLLWWERSTSQNSPGLSIVVIWSIVWLNFTVWGKDLLCASRGWIMLFMLSVKMKRKTTYQHFDIASLWQIGLLLLEQWLGMARQKFMNSQCGRQSRNSGWRTILWHKARRHLVFVRALYVPEGS